MTFTARKVSTGSPFSSPRSATVYSPFCSASASAPGRDVDLTTVTLPSQPQRSASASSIQSANPRRNTPAPNCTARTGRAGFGMVFVMVCTGGPLFSV